MLLCLYSFEAISLYKERQGKVMLGIYIHIPFCVKKCNYCDFVSLEQQDLMEGYFEALCRESALTGNMYGRKVDSVFFGGGTPSYPDAKYIQTTLHALREQFELCEDSEITLEANPCSLTQKKLAVYREAGINRLSIGLQAVQENLLNILGRQHTKEQFEQAFQCAREEGFENINIDAIYGVPQQTKEDWEEMLCFLLGQEPEHISAYALKLEEGTPMMQAVEHGELVEADEDIEIQMYHDAQKHLAEHGYINYEISNFAKEGFECRHNLKYWNRKDYLGLGVAAHSCIKDIRFANTSDVKQYIAQLSEGALRYATSELITEREKKLEYIMLKLRLKTGFTFYDYKSKFGEDFKAVYAQELNEVVALGLAKTDDRGIRPTSRGFDLQNQLVSVLISNL